MTTVGEAVQGLVDRFAADTDMRDAVLADAATSWLAQKEVNEECAGLLAQAKEDIKPLVKIQGDLNAADYAASIKSYLRGVSINNKVDELARKQEEYENLPDGEDRAAKYVAFINTGRNTLTSHKHYLVPEAWKRDDTAGDTSALLRSAMIARAPGDHLHLFPSDGTAPFLYRQDTGLYLLGSQGMGVKLHLNGSHLKMHDVESTLADYLPGEALVGTVTAIGDTAYKGTFPDYVRLRGKEVDITDSAGARVFPVGTKITTTTTSARLTMDKAALKTGTYSGDVVGGRTTGMILGVANADGDGVGAPFPTARTYMHIYDTAGDEVIEAERVDSTHIRVRSRRELGTSPRSHAIGLRIVVRPDFRCNVHLDRTSQVGIYDGVLHGTYDRTGYSTAVENQHGIASSGSLDSEADGLLILDVRGDGCYANQGLGSSGSQTKNMKFTHGVIDGTLRMGIGPVGVENFEASDVYLDHVSRSAIDLEPLGANQYVNGVKLLRIQCKSRGNNGQYPFVAGETPNRVDNVLCEDLDSMGQPFIISLQARGPGGGKDDIATGTDRSVNLTVRRCKGGAIYGTPFGAAIKCNGYVNITAEDNDIPLQTGRNMYVIKGDGVGGLYTIRGNDGGAGMYGQALFNGVRYPRSNASIDGFTVSDVPSFQSNAEDFEARISTATGVSVAARCFRIFDGGHWKSSPNLSGAFNYAKNRGTKPIFSMVVRADNMFGGTVQERVTRILSGEFQTQFRAAGANYAAEAALLPGGVLELLIEPEPDQGYDPATSTPDTIIHRPSCTTCNHGRGYSANQFKALYRYVVEQMRIGAGTNSGRINFTWALTGTSLRGTNGRIGVYWPGLDVVDVCGVEPYYPTDASMVTGMRGDLEVAAMINHAAANNLPLAIPEWGVLDGQAHSASCIRDNNAFITENDVIYSSYYNVNQNGNWLLTSQASLEAMGVYLTDVATLAITTSTLPTATRNSPYTNTQLAAVGGVKPYTWGLETGSALPVGMTLTAAGVLGGTPTVSGHFTPTFRTVDSTGRVATRTITLDVSSGPTALAITTQSPLASIRAGSTASVTLAAEGGSGGYTWPSMSGAPSGSTLNSSTGVLSLAPPTAGSFTIRVNVRDSSGTTAYADLSLTVDPAGSTKGARVGIQFAGANSKLTGVATATLDRMLAAVAAAGMKWIRYQMDWNVRELTQNVLTWDRADAVVQKCNALGINIIMGIAYTPPWARSSVNGYQRPPDDAATYGAYFRKVVARYTPTDGTGGGPTHSNITVKHFQVWNEPNQNQFWTGNMTQYAALIKAAWADCQANLPTAVKNTYKSVIGVWAPPGGATPADAMVTFGAQLDALYTNGIAGKYHMWDMHCYAGTQDPALHTFVSHPIWDCIPLIRTKMLANNDSGHRFISSELGYRTSGGPNAVPPITSGLKTVTEANAGTWSAKQIDVMQGISDIDLIFFYEGVDQDTSSTTDGHMHAGHFFYDDTTTTKAAVRNPIALKCAEAV